MISDYFEYEVKIGANHLGPRLQKQGFDLNGGRVLDVGCGYGGVMEGLAKVFPKVNGIGIDRDSSMIAKGQPRISSQVNLRVTDFFNFEDEPFDFILMRDVLEHIEGFSIALQRAADLMKPKGWLFVSFAPFLGPFGGHQHNGSGPFAYCPWVHLLPETLFLGLLPVKGNSYKGDKALAEDIRSVLATRLTVAGFKKAVQKAGLTLAYQDLYLSRPEYRLKLGLPALPLPDWPGIREWFCTGGEFLAQRV